MPQYILSYLHSNNVVNVNENNILFKNINPIDSVKSKDIPILIVRQPRKRDKPISKQLNED